MPLPSRFSVCDRKGEGEAHYAIQLIRGNHVICHVQLYSLQLNTNTGSFYERCRSSGNWKLQLLKLQLLKLQLLKRQPANPTRAIFLRRQGMSSPPLQSDVSAPHSSRRYLRAKSTRPSVTPQSVA